MCRVTSGLRKMLDHARLKCMSCGSEWDETFPELEPNQELMVGEHIPDACVHCFSDDTTVVVIALVYNASKEKP